MGSLRAYRPSLDDVVALLAGVGTVAGSFAAVGFTPAVVVSPVERELARSMPGIVVAAAIQTLGSLGQQLNLLTAAVLVVVGVALVARTGLALAARRDGPFTAVLVTGLGVLVAAGVVTGSLLSALGSAIGAGLVLAFAGGFSPSSSLSSEDHDRNRRRVLSSFATVTGIGVFAWWQSSRPTDRSPESSAGSPADDVSTPTPEMAPADADATVDANADANANAGADTDPNADASQPSDPDQSAGTNATATETPSLLERAAANSMNVDGLEPLVSDNFYNVDINAVDPDVDADSWSLSVTGAVEEELTFDMDDVRSMESRTEFVTLRCVGEGRNGKKMDNALWTGVPAMDLVQQANPNGECECVMFRAADDYFEEFPLAALEGGLFAYEMNGEPLPRSHGYPLRALVPGHWGEINVKWLTEIEILERETDGYWEKRGWHGTGPVTTVAKLHAVNDLSDSRKQVGGHAYAGLRGVSGVEVSTDGGDTWNDAQLSEPLPGRDVWRQWVYEYEPPGGRHEVVVRAIEEDGTVQPSEERKPFPRGPTGWVSKTIS